MKDVLTALEELDWENADLVEQAAAPILGALADDPAELRDAITQVPGNPALFAMSEHYPNIFDKVVLQATDTGIRLRLHVFLPGYTEQPHNHRWSFASHILHGGYRHYLYGAEDLTAITDRSQLAALHVRSERPGSSYGLHHAMVHLVIPEGPYTVSLIVRGPAMKDRYHVLQADGGDATARYGAADEKPEVAAIKKMSEDRLHEIVKMLEGWRVL